jgi:hypothetical protein
LILVATACARNIVQSGEGGRRFPVTGPHFCHDAPGFDSFKKVPQVHIGAAQFAPGRGVSRLNRNLILEVLDTCFEGSHVRFIGVGRQGRVVNPRIVPGGGTSDGAHDKDGGGNQDQGCSVHGVFSDTMGWSAITPDDEYRGQMRGFIA